MPDPAERYWLEITNREDLGTDLWAPQTDYAGRDYWSYRLITYIRADDVVLHWHKSLIGKPAIVAWSYASGEPELSEITWQARGTVGRQQAAPRTAPAWRMPLEEHTPLLHPVTQSTLRDAESAVRLVYARVRQGHEGPLYFPFALSERRPIRTAQGYLVKFPVALLEVFPELTDVPRPDVLRKPAQAASVSGGKERTDSDAWYMNDPRVRKAVERHAVRRATEYFEALGYRVEDVGNRCSYTCMSAMRQKNAASKSKGRPVLPEQSSSR